jgi:hypothetical protein
MCNQKCASLDCDNIVDKASIWCDKCLKEFDEQTVIFVSPKFER